MMGRHHLLDGLQHHNQSWRLNLQTDLAETEWQAS